MTTLILISILQVPSLSKNAMQIRLYVHSPLNAGSEIPLSESQVHYLRNVLRSEKGQDIFLFNGKDGEYSGTISVLEKKKGYVTAEALLRPQPDADDVRLYFAPLKRDNTDLVVEKATELGVTEICPVLTAYTVTSRVNIDRLQSIAIEASEQCRRLDIPKISAPVPLKTLLASRQPTDPILLHLDESGNGKPAREVISTVQGGVGFLIGPEGGFSEQERKLIEKMPHTTGIDLGPRILRAETAAIAALALYACQ